VSDTLAYVLTAALIVAALVIVWWSIRRARHASPQWPQRTVDEIRSRLDNEQRRPR
jgi:hypothetical protein